MVLAIARNLAEKNNFRDYFFKEDFIMEACIDMLRAARSFDLTRKTDGRPTSAFSYLTLTRGDPS